MARLSHGDSPEQAKVRQCVVWYKKSFPEEYMQFVAQMEDARVAATFDTGLNFKGSEGRLLHEIPETMFNHMVKIMTVADMEWFSTNRANHWFVRTFPEFSLVRAI